ncbi:Fic family protein [Candidatus Poribacteria bacterium]|nr:Fic family protein [Candidatus Poribacteria bacterium]
MDVFDEINTLKIKVDSYRPIPPEKMELIDEKFTLDWTYHSNAIEGNTLSRQETAFFLKRGLTVQGKTMSEYLEVQNHVEAIEWLKEIVKRNRPITESLIKELHALLLRGIGFVWVGAIDNRMKKQIYPGKYKTDPNNVLTMNGNIHYYCEPLLVPDRMAKLVQIIQEGNYHFVQLAAIAHYELVAIHPFADGNGRVGRMLMNLILMQHGYPPAVIKNETKEIAYYRALMDGDKGNLEPFIRLVATEVKSSLQLMLDILEGRAGITEVDLAKKLRNLDQKVNMRENHVDTHAITLEKSIRSVTGIAQRIIQRIIDQNPLEKLAFYIDRNEFPRGVAWGTPLPDRYEGADGYDVIELSIEGQIERDYASGVAIAIYLQGKSPADERIFANLLFSIFATERRIYIAAICYIVYRSTQVVGTSSWELDNLINDAIEAEVRELFFRCLTLLESHL